MPDADKFERLLRGKGWRRAYRLASGNAPMSMVVDALINAAARGLREQVQCPSLSRILEQLCHSLAARADRHNSEVADGEDTFVSLMAAFNEIEADDFGYLGTRLARKRAEKVFVELARRKDTLEFEEVRDRFAEVFIADLVDNQCLFELRKLESEVCRASRVERHQLQEKLVRLYSQYTAEWESFSARRFCDRGRQIA